MKKHNCEKFRFTEMKYKVVEGTNDIDFTKPVLVSICSLCGKLLRKVLTNF
jgi:hypothetical protein